MRQLEDLEYADDITLISSMWAQAQTKLERPGGNSIGPGLKINIDKSKLLRLKARRHTESYFYHGVSFNNSGGTEQETRRKFGRARSAFYRLSKALGTSEFRLETKVRTFNSNIFAVLRYGYETWRMTKVDANRLDTFFHKYLRRILKVH